LDIEAFRRTIWLSIGAVGLFVVGAFLACERLDQNGDLIGQAEQDQNLIKKEGELPEGIESLNVSVQKGSKESHSPERLEELTDILASPNIEHADKWKAVQDLKKLGKNATLELIKILKEADKGNSHYYAIRALGYIKNPAATETLCEILVSRKYGPRRYAAIALGQIGDPRAVDALQKSLDDVPHVRGDVLDALVKINKKKAREVLDQWHFGDTTPGLQMEIVCDKSVYAVGEQIRIDASLANASEKSVQLAAAQGERYGYLVFKRKDGAFVEEVGTRMWEARVIRQEPLHELAHGAKLEYPFLGRVAMWTRGEKEDHTFVPSEVPFLTLDFRWVAFHIRQRGEYEVRCVLKQDEDLLRKLKAIGVSEDKLKLIWQGKVVSNPVSFSVTEKSSVQDKASSNQQRENNSVEHIDGAKQV
jgi:hypothetical protein